MWKKFRFWLMKTFINMAITVADKDTIEGVSLILAMKDWIQYINSEQANDIRNGKIS